MDVSVCRAAREWNVAYVVYALVDLQWNGVENIDYVMLIVNIEYGGKMRDRMYTNFVKRVLRLLSKSVTTN
ncbi:hypothetical protein WN51_04281 [Melipona quadrifasciata]|uniref:Uncharacterized protein n=1 Tax=Melipona quadrifasciata TaxID=166423 RepID=A0A0M8ZQU1_9HYME|nr:hypothetical protein WN51_04281 [Melipona quadrifasciata]